MIRALFKFAPKVDNAVEVDTTSGSGDFRELSPFILRAPPARNLENLWQFSKVYPEFVDALNNPLPSYYEWRDNGWNDERAHRYPMGKGRKPLYSIWGDMRLEYVDARKVIYAPMYAMNVGMTDSYLELRKLYDKCCAENRELILRDYDAYDHVALGMSLKDVINNPNKKMGHAFVLIMMLVDLLDECIAL